MLQPARRLLCKLDFADMQFSLWVEQCCWQRAWVGWLWAAAAPASWRPGGRLRTGSHNCPRARCTSPTTPCLALAASRSYFLGYQRPEDVPEDPVERAKWMFGLPACLEL